MLNQSPSLKSEPRLLHQQYGNIYSCILLYYVYVYILYTQYTGNTEDLCTLFDLCTLRRNSRILNKKFCGFEQNNEQFRF